MTGRYEGRVERQNEYFISGDGISREVIQADICRYLGNDALVRPGNHNVRVFSTLICSLSPRTFQLTNINRVARASLSVPTVT